MTQSARQAIIEILFLSLYLDNHISLVESEALEAALAELGWDSPHPKEIFILNAFARARKAAATEEDTATFLAERARVILEKSMGGPALAWLGTVLAVDGLSHEEEIFLNRLQILLLER